MIVIKKKLLLIRKNLNQTSKLDNGIKSVISPNNSNNLRRKQNENFVNIEKDKSLLKIDYY